MAGEPSSTPASSRGVRHSIGQVLELLRSDFPGLSIPKIRFLEDKGLITREADPTDQRAMQLSLTPKGLAVQQEIGREHVKHIYEQIGTALSEDEFIQLQQLTSKLRSAIQ